MKRAVVAFLLFGAVAGCGDPTGSMPGRFDARYAAVTVGETPLPVSLKFFDSERTLHADTLSFSADGTALRTTVIRVQQFYEPFRDLRIVSRGTYSYKVDGKGLTLTTICGPAENCIGPVAGQITDDELRLPSSLLGLDYGRLFMDRIR